MPIIRSDNDIENILSRIDKTVNNILDMFIRSRISVHILRAIEPNMRFGSAIKSHIAISKDIPLCQYRNTERADQCIHLASRKQIGDALVKYEDRIVVNKH